MGCGQAESPGTTSGPTSRDVSSVSPAPEQYKQDLVEGDLWQRPDLSPRDRSAVTLAALIAWNQTSGLTHQLHLAPENGLRPEEVSEIITHLAFYSGWPNVFSALPVVRDVLQRRSR
jgi:4-carboxymuconolactone decarboxylase